MLELLEEEYESLSDDPEMQEEYANIKVGFYCIYYSKGKNS